MFYRITSSRKLSGFTLIEMLIVVVIIGILASTLIPRFSSIQGKARDTSRKASLQQLATAFTMYQSEYGSFPVTGGNISQYSGILANYMGKIPRDPTTTKAFAGISTNGSSCQTGSAGEFQYIPLNRGGTDGMGFSVIANPEDVAGANRLGGAGLVGSGMTTDGCILQNTQAETLQTQECERVVQGTTTAFGSPCTMAKGQNNRLRYILTQ